MNPDRGKKTVGTAKATALTTRSPSGPVPSRWFRTAWRAVKTPAMSTKRMIVGMTRRPRRYAIPAPRARSATGRTVL